MANPSHFNDDFLNISELAAWLHISVRHVRADSSYSMWTDK